MINFAQILETLILMGEQYVGLLVTSSFNGVMLHIEMSETKYCSLVVELDKKLHRRSNC
jgi:hypothetical protein